MKVFIKRISLFSIPILLWLGIFVLIDPFNYFNISNLIDDSIKKSTLDRGITTRINEQALWKLLEYDRLNSENVIIGDSRITAINI